MRYFSLIFVFAATMASAQNYSFLGWSNDLNAVLELDLSDGSTATLETGRDRVVGTTYNSGWYVDQFHETQPSLNANYFVGFEDGIEFRNFFTFSTQGLTLGSRSLVGARLIAIDNYIKNDAESTYVVRHVATPGDELVTYRNLDRPDIYADLADGAIYGTYSIPIADATDIMTERVITLDPVAIMNGLGADAGRPDYFSLGGSVVVGSLPVPEPASMAVLGIGLAALKRRRAKK